MNKTEQYVLDVEQMKHLKKLGLRFEKEDSLVYWVKFIQTKGNRKCHKWKKSIRSAEELNQRNPMYGHYIGMPAYTLQQVICKCLEHANINSWTMSAVTATHVDSYFNIAYTDLCRALEGTTEE